MRSWPSDGRLAWLREAPWLGRARVLGYCRTILLVAALAWCGWILAGKGLIDPMGRPVGPDFVSFWSASKLALGGEPAAAYDQATHRAVEREAVGGAEIPYYAWFYPPVFLLIILPLALLPYGWSLFAWLAVTGATYAAVMRNFVRIPGALGPILAFPAALLNAMYGQNGFLSVALLGGGMLLLRGRPVLAGVLLGAMIYKPHLALLIPVALLFGAEWLALATAAATALLLLAVSFAFFHAATFAAFLAQSDTARLALEQGLVSWTKMQSIFAAIRLLGGPIPLAYAAQVLAAAVATALVVVVWRRPADGDARAATLAAATLLVSPFLLDYDLVLLAIPLAWLAREGVEKGFMSWEKLLLALAWASPLLLVPFAEATRLQLAPLVCAGVLSLVLRRSRFRRLGLYHSIDVATKPG